MDKQAKKFSRRGNDNHDNQLLSLRCPTLHELSVRLLPTKDLSINTTTTKCQVLTDYASVMQEKCRVFQDCLFTAAAKYPDGFNISPFISRYAPANAPANKTCLTLRYPT